MSVDWRDSTTLPAAIRLSMHVVFTKRDHSVLRTDAVLRGDAENAKGGRSTCARYGVLCELSVPAWAAFRDGCKRNRDPFAAGCRARIALEHSLKDCPVAVAFERVATMRSQASMVGRQPFRPHACRALAAQRLCVSHVSARFRARGRRTPGRSRWRRARRRGDTSRSPTTDASSKSTPAPSRSRGQ